MKSLIEIPINSENEDECKCKYEDYKFIFKPSNINNYVTDLQKKFIVKNGLDYFDVELSVLEKFYNQRSNPDLYIPTSTENTKNRYRDFYITDKYRVKLPPLLNDPSSSFINATYLYNILPNSKKYIVASAPLPNGFRDWWRMIYENNVGIIVMLTDLVETDNRKKRKYIKAHQYWPEYKNDNEDAYIKPYPIITKDAINYLTVRRLSIINKSNELRNMNLNEQYQIEIFIVSMYDSKLKEIGFHKIIFLWNKSLPDNGAPVKTKTCDQYIQYKKFVILFNKLYYKYYNKDHSVLVHCSAGLGRSGFFIAIDMILDNISRRYLNRIMNTITNKNNKLQKLNLTQLPAISVFEIIKCMRIRRPKMISNKSQYIFIYMFIAYCLKKFDISKN